MTPTLRERLVALAESGKYGGDGCTNQLREVVIIAAKMALEDAATTAKKHHAPPRRASTNRFATDVVLQSIRDEERGEEIAASVIDNAIRALSASLDNNEERA